MSEIVDEYADIHIIPLNDFKEHIQSKNCWCNPKSLEYDDQVIVHNAMDQREKYERGELMYHH